MDVPHQRNVALYEFVVAVGGLWKGRNDGLTGLAVATTYDDMCVSIGVPSECLGSGLSYS